MNDVLNIDLQRLTVSDDQFALENYVRLYQIEILNQWTNSTHDDLEKFLRLSEQKVSRAKRSIDQQDGTYENAFSLGMVMGFVTIFRELLREEKKDQRIVAMCASQTEKADQILMALASRNGGQGMRHGELAEAVGIPYSSLTNIMKRILQSRAAEATRSGKNTYYTLTKAGRRYCAKKQESPNTAVLQHAWERLRSLMKEVETAGHDSEIGLYAGDDVTIATQNDHYIQRVRIRLIAESAKGKFALFENTDQESVLAENRMNTLIYGVRYSGKGTAYAAAAD